ncbi:TonB-dependent receptor [Ekhidna sp.]|uniref:TonB-dependent receptor n=1 Tax=Ekhidna sp. TaxID=2608089 RepID=UPI0032999BD6
MKILLTIIVLLSSALTYAQILVRGTVVDSQAEPLPGATIVEKDTQNGVISDYNGDFEISVSSEDASLLVSFVGFQTQEVLLSGNKQVSIVMPQDISSLEGVEVTGFMGVIGKARRRTADIQSTPESVTALNAEGLSKAGVTDINSFSTLVPNMKFNTAQAVGINFITVRGIPQVRNGDAPVAFVIDGVTIPDPALLNQELYDLALVEVVKGPQGALYGKNAIGGAINIYTLDPSNTFSNKVRVGYGNGNSRLSQAISSGSILKDKLYFRVSTQYRETDGLLTNDFLDEKVDFRRDINLRAQLRAELSSRTSIVGSYQYFDLDGGAAYYSVNPTGNLFEPGTPGGVLDPNPKEGNNVIVSNILGESDMKNHYSYLKFEHLFENMRFQSISSYNKVKRSTFGDFDFLEFNDFTQNERTSTQTINQEFRFQNLNANAKLSWDFGGFFQNVEEPLYQDGLVTDFDTFDQFNVVAADVVNETRTFAFFGFAEYSLTDKFLVAAGFRYDIDRLTQDDLLFDVNSSRNNNEFQPKVTLSYQSAENILFFANYGKGYRTGGFNPATTDLFDRGFKDETTNNYELGYKTSWWNNRFIFNGSVFYTDYQNQQQYILDLNEFFPGIYNYDESRIIGFEVDSRVRLTKWLDIIANYGYTDAEIIAGGSVGGADGNATDNEQYNGNKTPFVPVSNYNLGLASNVSINDDLIFKAFVNWNNTGKTYWHESNRPEHISDAYNLLDSRFSLGYKNWEFALWGRNLTNTQYYQEFSIGEFFGSPEDVGWRGQPRAFGAELAVKF